MSRYLVLYFRLLYVVKFNVSIYFLRNKHTEFLHLIYYNQSEIDNMF